MRTKILRNSRVYARALEREGKFWKGQGNDPVVGTCIDALQRYKDSVETGSDRFSYFGKLGPFSRGLSVGCGSGNVERELMKRGIVKSFTFIDVSEESLQMLQNSLKGLKKRATIKKQDLNFLSLEKDSYDFIFCANILHHVVNLEHVLLELNKAVTLNGIIFIDDFVGEDRFQFSDERISLINAIGLLAHKQTGVKFTPMKRTSRKALINSCPFESIRSSELLGLLHELWGKTTVKEGTYGAVSSWSSVVLDFSQQDDKLSRALEIFIAFDKMVLKEKLLPPLYVSGVYKKRLSPPAWNVRLWTAKELKYHLPVRKFDEKYAYEIGKMLSRTVGNGRVYRCLKNTYMKIRN